MYTSDSGRDGIVTKLHPQTRAIAWLFIGEETHRRLRGDYLYQTPEKVFEYRWAATILSRAMSRLRQDSVDSGKEAQFDGLKQYLTSLESDVPYRQTADVLGISEGAVKTAVYRLRKRLGQCLRAEVADTVADPSQVDAELRQILSMLRS